MGEERCPAQRIGHHRPVEVRGRESIRKRNVDRLPVLSRSHPTRLVDVQPEEVDRCVHLGEIGFVVESLCIGAVGLEPLLGIAAQADRIDPPRAVEVMIGIHGAGGDPPRLDRGRRLVDRTAGAPHGGVADPARAGAGGSKSPHRVAVSPHGVVTGQELVTHRQLQTGSVGAVVVTMLDVDLGFVQGDPVDDAISETTTHQIGVLAHPGGAVAADPATLREQCRRHVPVEQGRPRLDPGFQQGVDQPVVVVEPLLIDLPGAFGEHPRPGDREAIGVEPELPHDLNVILESVVVIAGHRTTVSVFDGPLTIAEVVPDASPTTTFEGRTLDLIGGGGGTPKKAFRKLRHESNSS